MSAGAFENSRYEDENLNIRRIRVQPETLLLEINSTVNAAPAGALDSGYASAQVSQGRRSLGCNARLVRVKFSGTPPTGYKPDSVISLPWLSQSTFAALQPGQTGTYLSSAIELVGKTAESIR